MPSWLEPGAWVHVPDPTCGLHEARGGEQPLLAGLTRAAETREALGLERRGYSIVWDARSRPAGDVVHLTAGSRTR